MKLCKECKEEKDLTNYYKSCNYYYNKCKKCHIKYCMKEEYEGKISNKWIKLTIEQKKKLFTILNQFDFLKTLPRSITLHILICNVGRSLGG